MTFHVFNIGLNKAGTSSLYRALNMLDIPSLHFTVKNREGGQTGRVQLSKLVKANLREGKRAFDGLDETYRGFADFGGGKLVQTLDEQYPGSKFILTLRDKESWIESRIKHELRKLKRPNYDGSTVTISPNVWRETYDRIVDGTQAYFKDRPGDLLVIDITDGAGWDPLCAFLGVPVPDEPFPWLNSAERKERQIKAAADAQGAA